LNIVSLIGNLATDVELKVLDDDRKVASFVVAIDRAGRDGADFVRVAVWNKQAELCSRSLAKGSQVGIDGRLRSRTWEDADGRRRTAVEVVANHVAFLSPERPGDVPTAPEGAME
jgi:single-strand DNA-binding protein